MSDGAAAFAYCQRPAPQVSVAQPTAWLGRGRSIAQRSAPSATRASQNVLSIKLKENLTTKFSTFHSLRCTVTPWQRGAHHARGVAAVERRRGRSTMGDVIRLTRGCGVPGNAARGGRTAARHADWVSQRPVPERGRLPRHFSQLLAPHARWMYGPPTSCR
jgi:hypothetical protein